ncbi:hypothetical protein F5H01DRAFT_59657 [Linnemannia elongata]|nr:hypothetical protein F5H01DRAFT_59657 [Linnemannia elongata]
MSVTLLFLSPSPCLCFFCPNGKTIWTACILLRCRLDGPHHPSFPYPFHTLSTIVCMQTESEESSFCGTRELCGTSMHAGENIDWRECVWQNTRPQCVFLVQGGN